MFDWNYGLIDVSYDVIVIGILVVLCGSCVYL